MSLPKTIDYPHSELIDNSKKESIEEPNLNDPIFEETNTRELLSGMKHELGDNPRLHPKEIGAFEFITNKMFLEDYTIDERLKYVTKNNILPSEIIDGTHKEITFSFDFDGNGKINKNLYFKTTAGQVLPQEVESVSIGNEVFSRSNLAGEFFDKNNKRLIIHHNTAIKIEKLRTKEEIDELEKANFNKVNTYEDSQDFDIALEATRRGINIGLIFELFSKLLSNFSGTEREIEMENLFTEVDRKRGRGRFDENSEELKNNLKDENDDGVLDSDKFNWYSIDFSNVGKGEEGLLDFISIAEGTYGNYNAIYGNGDQSKINFTDMTLGEILDYQKKYTDNGSYSSAIGKYQFIRQTLLEMVSKYGIDMDEKFTPELQDRLALLKMKEYGLDEFKNNGDTAKFQYKLSQIWASIPKDKSGLSYYSDDGVNNARVKPKDIQNQLQTFFG